jgi:hypothetical protein
MSLIKINWTPDNKHLRTFAVGATLVCVALALQLNLKGVLFGIHLSGESARAGGWGLAVLAAACGASALFFPAAVKPLYLTLSVVTFPVGMVVSQLILAAIFYLVFAPAGLIGRLAGWNPMDSGFSRTAKSYWRPRTHQVPARRYFRQY